MKRTLSSILSLSLMLLGCSSAMAEGSGTLLYQGHGSLRIVTCEGKVIYIDPYAGEGYDLSADLILITHAFYRICILYHIIRKLIHVFLFSNTSVSDSRQSFLPACCKICSQKTIN